MVSSNVCRMASEPPVVPGLFIPQTVFAVNNLPVLMGILKKGDLVLSMTTFIKGNSHKLIDIQVLNQHQKSVKSGGKEIVVGITLSNISIESAQKIVNQELLFK